MQSILDDPAQCVIVACAGWGYDLAEFLERRALGFAHRDEARTLRQHMPDSLFLVPGYGAQGGGVDDVLPCFHADGTGAVVTASRSVLYPATDGGTWTDAVRSAAEQLAEDIGRATGFRD